MELATIGKMLVGIGILLALVGLFLVGVARLTGTQGWRLPGDAVIRRDHVTIYLPLATSLLISLLLTALLLLISFLSRR